MSSEKLGVNFVLKKYQDFNWDYFIPEKITSLIDPYFSLYNNKYTSFILNDIINKQTNICCVVIFKWDYN